MYNFAAVVQSTQTTRLESSMKRLKLPIGIADFRSIRTEGYCYVDKTALIEALVDQGRHYFLSRPRRFGKSLLLDTMRELFQGSEVLFKGLDIHSRWDWSATHPVVRLSLDGGYSRRGELESDVMTQLDLLESAHDMVPVRASGSYTASSRLRRLLYHLHDKTGRQAVVLVDEYDKPILDALDDRQLALDNRDYLRSLYGVIKASGEHVRFVFVAGVTMFSKVSLFSGLNNLNDISIDPRYADICGYTEAEMDAVFGSELDGLDRAEVRRWYNGYCWGGEGRVYNPWDILNLLDTRAFKAHWFASGEPTFLYKLMMRRRFAPMDVENLKVAEDFVSKFDVDDISAEALMFQAGYLTITGQRHDGAENILNLDYPNFEVRSRLSAGYLDHLFGPGRASPFESRQLAGLLAGNDFDGFAAALRRLLAAIPNEWHANNDMAGREGWYCSVLHACLWDVAQAGLRPEESTSRGRSDLVVALGDQVFVFECKMVKGADADKVASDAVAQIRDMGYADRHRAGTGNTHLIGAAFSAETRNLAAITVQPA